MGTLQDVGAVVKATRRRTLVVAVAIVLIPTVLLVVRWEDPSRGQIPFGWQMHTSCWGDSGDTGCDAP